MANANSVIIRNSKKSSTPSAANLAHNSTLRKANYWLDKDKEILQSYKPKDLKEVNRIWQNWCNMARARYLQKHKRQIRADAVLIEEGLIVIGKDVVADDKQIEKIAKDFFAKFEKDNNTRVLHYAIHTHEGHEKSGTQEINRHIHFLFDNVDKDGNMVRRNWKRSYLKQLQDDIYEASKKHIANIQRATDYAKLGQKAPKQKHHRVFRKEQEQKDLKEQLKAEIAELRKQLKEQGAVRADYAKLEQLNKDLKEQIKAKELTVHQLQKQLEQYKQQLDSKTKENTDLKALLEKKESELSDSKTELETEIKECNKEAKEILELEEADTSTTYSPIALVKFLKETVVKLIQEKNSLRETIKALLSDLRAKDKKILDLESKIAQNRSEDKIDDNLEMPPKTVNPNRYR